MNEPERFGLGYGFVMRQYFERIQTMTENQVISELRAMQAFRNSLDSTLGFIRSVSIAPRAGCDDEFDRLRSQVDSRPGVNPIELSGYLEDALKKRLEILRERGT